MSRFKYKAFISYSHEDAELSKWLHRKLEAYPVPKRLVGKTINNKKVPARFFPIFRDRDDLAATPHMTDAILDAIRSSEFLIVICTPASAKSKLVAREIEEFRRLNGNINILCLIARGTPFSTDPEQECFPEVLRNHVSCDETEVDRVPEGLAADIRPGCDSRQTAVSKLVAGMIGVDLNDLLRRELIAQKKRLLHTLAASLLVILIITGLLVTAIEAKRTAEQRTSDAVDLLAFLHDDLFVAFDSDGNTKAQETLARITLQHFDKLRLDSASVKVLGAWSGNALRLGQNLERQGRNEEASAIFKQIRQFGIELSEQNPHHHFARFRKQNAEFFYGYLKQRTGKYEEAEASFRTRLDVAQRAESDPKLTIQTPGIPINWPPIVADSQQLLANLLGGPRDKVDEAYRLVGDAVKNWHTALGDFKPTSKTPDATGHYVSLASAYLIRGHIEQRLGLLDSAASSYVENIKIYDELLASNPNDLNYLRRKAVAETRLASVIFGQGLHREAIDLASGSLGTFIHLTEKNPSSVLWLAGLMNAQNTLFEMLLMKGRIDDAGALLSETKRTSGLLMKKDLQRPHYRLAIYKTRLLEAEYNWATGKNSESIAAIENLISDIENETSTFPNTVGSMEFISRVYLFSAAVQASTGAPWSREKLRSVVETVYGRPNPWPVAKAYAASALAKNGETELSKEIFSELASIGFVSAEYISFSDGAVSQISKR